MDAAAQQDNQELGQARAQYEKEVEFSTKPIRDRYLSRLETLKRTLGSRGDARAALAVEEEINRVKEFSAQATGKGRFEGLWTIRYDNGVVRKVSIDANDVLTMLEEGNQPKNLKAKMATYGGDCLVDWGDGAIEKMTLANAKLVIEHFNPKSIYPKGPSLHAVGTRGPSK
jgi:hypothetical protein